MRTCLNSKIVSTLFAACCILTTPTASAANSVDVIDVVTEEFPPFNFTEHGKLTGFSTEVVEALLKEVRVQGRFQVLPWARAYDMALNTENVLIYTIIRTAPRENKFEWIGIVAQNSTSLFSLSERHLKLSNLDDAKKFQIATVNEDVGEQFLLSKSFVKGQNLQSGAKYPLGYEKLKLGRIDIWAMTDMVAYYLVKKTGDDPVNVLDPILRLGEISNDGLYIAFGAKTSVAMVERFKHGFEAIRKNGVFDAIKKKMAVAVAI